MFTEQKKRVKIYQIPTDANQATKELAEAIELNWQLGPVYTQSKNGAIKAYMVLTGYETVPHELPDTSDDKQTKS